MIDEIISILTFHTKKYPLMQPCDVIKLLYQNEFGGGHIIQDEKQSLLNIKKEYNALSIEMYSDKMYLEEIGNQLIRFPLYALRKNFCTPEQLNQLFILSSAKHKGTLSGFLYKIDIIKNHFSDFSFSFSKNDLELYLAQYEKDSYPMVSHSQTYRDAYKPAYRIVRKEYLEKDFSITS